MKLSPSQIDQAINLLPGKYKAILIYGPDAGLVAEKSNIAIDKLFRGKVDKYNLINFSSSQIKEPALIFNEINNLSFFGDFKVIKITELTASISPVLKEILEYDLKNNFIILVADDLSPTSSLRKFAENHPEIFTIPCYKDDLLSIENIIKSYFIKNNIKFDAQVPHIISQYLLGDRLLIKTELEKIAIYLNGNYLTIEIAEDILTNCAELELDQFIMNFFSQNYQNFIEDLQLALSQISNVGMIRMLIKHCFKLVEIIKIKETQGISNKQAITLLKPPIFFKHHPAIEKQLSIWNKEYLILLLEKLYKLEKLSKSNDYLEVLLRNELLMGNS